MAKRLAVPTIALVALILPAAAAASALTMPVGTLVPTTTALLATSSDFHLETALGTLTCTKVEFPEKVIENNGTKFRIDETGDGTLDSCKFNGNDVDVDGGRLIRLESTTSAIGTAALAFNVEVLPGVLVCKYAGVMPFTYTAGSGAAVLKKGSVTSTGCGGGELSATLSLETKAGGAVILD